MMKFYDKNIYSVTYSMMKYILFFLLFSVMHIAPSFAIPSIIGVESSNISGEESITLLTNSSINHKKVFLLKKPHRLIVDLEKTSSKNAKLPLSHKKNLIKSMKITDYNDSTSRIIFGLPEKAVTVKLRHLDGQKNIPHKIIISLKATAPQKHKNEKHTITYLASKNNNIPSFKHHPTAKPSSPKRKPNNNSKRKNKKPLIIIDAGHGGKDPGATGASGKYEKHVTLSYAKKLRTALKRTGRYRVKLTRDSDDFILLHKRVELAQKSKGDIFISLHADSALTPSARGLSVYTVSEKASNKAAEALAKQENKADYIGETSANIEHEDEAVVDILLDLTRRDTKNKSSRLAEIMIETFKRKDIHIFSQAHHFAGFRVLKAPDIPSVLVEIGFISNQQDEKLFQEKHYQQKITSGIITTLDNYFN